MCVCVCGWVGDVFQYVCGGGDTSQYACGNVYCKSVCVCVSRPMCVCVCDYSMSV
jgi:hypothetical protein